MAVAIRLSERRAEHLLNDLLISQGWDLRAAPQGDLLFQSEYRRFPELNEALARASKSGPGHEIPEAILMDRHSAAPLAVIETKDAVDEIDLAVSEAERYSDAVLSRKRH